tara:strand:- start:6064 stop:6372 length:309 start_codon:yes stop_codon:yes gene_type:complete
MDISTDDIFRVVVYIIAIYLILVNNSGWINMVGWIILFAHLYKDITQMTCWPKWCEFVGLLLGIILIYNGYIIKNYFIVVLGAMKTIAHIRQYIWEDNCYYY